MTQVFHRHCHSDLPFATRGEGAYIYDQSGKAYLDASGGAAVSCLGHNHAGVRAALHAQIDQLAYAHSSFFTTEVAENLASRLTDKAPGSLNHVYFVSGGSEAVESALKLARQYFVETGEPQRTRFIARRQSYHGNTLGALAVGGNAWRRAPFSPLLMPAEHIAPCYPYRDQQPDESLHDYGQRVANELEQRLLTVGPETVIAFIAEPVVGATAGALAPVEGYYKRIREICDRYGILLILDEVMCGMGRTGTLFAHEQDGIEADLVTIAKGLGAGYQPIGAMLASDRIYDAISEGSGFFQHGHTYMAHATAMAGSLAVMDAFEKDGVLARVAPMGEALDQRLRNRFGDHPHVGDIRGRGLFQALELVHNRDSKKPFDSRSKLDKRIKAEAMQLGLMCYPMAGTIDGQRGHHILLAPPFIINEEQLDELTDKLYQAVDKITREALKEYPDAG
ncbi:aspartate aminotransferase family protein [Marinobacterium mangrovicola]|uniref:Adenosylmethionine-8-amino-7-oxononanoate aminotransferase n=1 Tax=Marinobacterium mangrovicola TaxID=1476959 RepID=A0A4R1G758_9GAMM|nr:aspartate aminotransferase family protein [Marinobacterium mangrovicola]TCK02370.1 adenosylmethionine-8-amino-7-oxononanoate aminotransferase [Marinobacterium mangrovicola]